MLKHFFFIASLLCLGANHVAAQPGNPCDPATVSQLQTDFLAQGFSCLENAGPFTCVDEVINFVLINCPDSGGGFGGNPCDSAAVGQLQADLIAQGFDCLQNAGPFECVNEVYEYAFENCPITIDTINPCSPEAVAQVESDFLAQGFSCLENAGPFTCVDEVINFVLTNCPDSGGGFGGNPCDSAAVSQLQADLVAQGFTCLEGAGPFECVDEVYEYVYINCSNNSGGDPCTPAAVQQAIDDLVGQGYGCVANAGPFLCVYEVVSYAMDNCPMDVDTTTVDVTECLLNVPNNILTFQQFLQYLIQNCDSTILSIIPSCWLNAPSFETDEEFLEWITENCELDSLVSGGGGALANRFFNSQGTTSTRQPAATLDMQVSPNPASAVVTVDLKDGELSRIELFDLDGRRRLVLENISGTQATLNLGQLPAGMYLLRVQNGDKGIATRRIVKE